MIKVLTIATACFENDGITNSILNYYRNIDKSKISMDFVMPNKLCDRLKEEFTENNTKYYELPERNRKPIQYILKLKHIIQEGKYDIVHAHGSSSILFLEMYAAYLAKCKIRIAHSRNTKSNHMVIHNILKPFFRCLYTDAFACGKEAGEWLFGKKKEVYIVKNGIDTSQYRYQSENREKKRKELGILDSDKVIGHIGRFSKEKNHDFILKIFYKIAKDSNTKLLLIGDRRRKKENRK